MIISGKIVDKATRQPVPFATVAIMRPDETYTGIGVAAGKDGSYYLKSDEVIIPNFARFSSIGYFDKDWELDYEDFYSADVEMERNAKTLPPVVVTSGNTGSNNAWLLLLLLPVLARKQRPAVGGIGKFRPGAAALIIGGGFLLFKGIDIISTLLNSLGLGTGPGASGANQQAENPNSPWKPAFYYAIPEGTNRLIIQESFVQDWISKIHNAFTVVQDDYNTIANVFNQLKTQSQVSYLADKFQQKYGEDLLSFLRDGGGILPWDGLSDTHLKTLIDLVNKLPKYMP